MLHAIGIMLSGLGNDGRRSSTTLRMTKNGEKYSDDELIAINPLHYAICSMLSGLADFRRNKH